MEFLTLIALFFCSAESVEILMQSCSKYQKRYSFLTGRAATHERCHSKKTYAVWATK